MPEQTFKAPPPRNVNPKFKPELKLFHNGPGDIPLVHLLYEAYSVWHKLLGKFPRSERYSLGEKSSTVLLSTLQNILAAATTSNLDIKVAKLIQASGELDTLKILARLTKKCKCISNAQYQQFDSQLHSAGKMLGAWLKSLESKKALSALKPHEESRRTGNDVLS